MFCEYCGKNIFNDAKFCNYCGGRIIKNRESHQKTATNRKKNIHKKNYIFAVIKNNVGKIIIIIIVISGIIGGIYDTLNEEAISKNNSAIEDFDKGKSYEYTISELQKAVNESYGDEAKINILKNLAYVEDTEGNSTIALANFKEALSYTKSNSFDYYLISGEIAYLEKKYNIALYNYEKAIALKQDDFQINNSLGIYYLDMNDEGHTDYNKALKYLKNAKINNPDSEILKENLAITYFFLEEYDIALNLFFEIDYNTKNYLNYWIGLCYFGKEDYLRAKIYLQQAVDSGMDVEQEIIDFLNFDL